MACESVTIPPGSVQIAIHFPSTHSFVSSKRILQKPIPCSCACLGFSLMKVLLCIHTHSSSFVYRITPCGHTTFCLGTHQLGGWFGLVLYLKCLSANLTRQSVHSGCRILIHRLHQYFTRPLMQWWSPGLQTSTTNTNDNGMGILAQRIKRTVRSFFWDSQTCSGIEILSHRSCGYLSFLETNRFTDMYMIVWYWICLALSFKELYLLKIATFKLINNTTIGSFLPTILLTFVFIHFDIFVRLP